MTISDQKAVPHQAIWVKDTCEHAERFKELINERQQFWTPAQNCSSKPVAWWTTTKSVLSSHPLAQEIHSFF